MDEHELWEAFKKTGRIADYLRYRGVDIYAAQNAVQKEGEQSGNPQGEGTNPHHRRTHYS